MATLSELKGSEIVIRLLHPLIEQKEERGILVTKLVEVESSGIWIEGRDLANFLHEKCSNSIIPKMPLFFVPFAQIGWITGSADYQQRVFTQSISIRVAMNGKQKYFP